MIAYRYAGLFAATIIIVSGAFAGFTAARGQAAAAAPAATPVVKDGSGNPAAVTEDHGKWADKNGNPTFVVGKDGKVDWYTYIGFLRYSANCLQCHGPDGLGSTYAPSLVDRFQDLSYGDVLGIVAGGMKNVSAAQDLVMPALGTNKNVMCYIDAIYIYLRARSDGALGRGRPASHVAKPAGYSATENSCMG